MVIRDVGADDYLQLASLLSQTQQRPFSAEYLENMAKRGFLVWNSRIAVQNNGRIVGACLLSQSASDGIGRYKIHVDVHPAWQRQGIGTALYQDALDFAQANGLSSLYAFVFEDRPRGLDFARKQGFAITRQAIHSCLDPATFNDAPFVDYLSRNEAGGIRFTTLADLGDKLENRRLLYELNKTCSADIPGRDPFFTFEEFCQWRFESQAYTASGVILALDGNRWVGLSAATHHQKENFVFNEMTGVIPQYRRRGLAIALKLLVVQFARAVGVDLIRTFNDSMNEPMLAVNRRMGYRSFTTSYSMETKFD
jgi:RimJ/RimL family protein N-acetyltransferase